MGAGPASPSLTLTPWLSLCDSETLVNTEASNEMTVAVAGTSGVYDV